LYSHSRGRETRPGIVSEFSYPSHLYRIVAKRTVRFTLGPVLHRVVSILAIRDIQRSEAAIVDSDSHSLYVIQGNIGIMSAFGKEADV
jgi:hypothetical protein